MQVSTGLNNLEMERTDTIHRNQSMTETRHIRVALVDDHVLLRKALAHLINGFAGCEVVFEAADGQELAEHIGNRNIDMVLLDLHMPRMNGYETTLWLREHYPDTRILMLTMYDAEEVLIRLLKAGVKGFLKKDIHPAELETAIHAVMDTGYYYTHHVSGKLADLFRGGDGDRFQLNRLLFTEQEMTFIKLACTDKTYKEIAGDMGLNPRSVDNLREHVFQKLDVKSRVGLAMYAMTTGIIIC